MRRVDFSILLIFSIFIFGCRGSSTHYYDSEAHADEALITARKAARESNKLILVSVGGDWCKWCVRLNTLISTNETLSHAVADRFIPLHVYHGKGGKNGDFLSRYGNPQQNGVPVFMVLDSTGDCLTTQSTGIFEEGEGYSVDPLLKFLRQASYTNNPAQ